MISLFAFILVLGLLVDDAIVVGENVHRHQESGDDAHVAAIRGTQEVATPVIFGVLTTVAAFMPLMVSPGHYGQVFSAIGLVVVVNSSLVLVHYVNQRRGAGTALSDAVREAGVARFRPIALTSMTTFAGLTPLLLEGSVSAQFLIPMAISLAFGVVFASSISLFLVPSLYLIFEDVKRGIRRFVDWVRFSARGAVGSSRDSMDGV